MLVEHITSLDISRNIEILIYRVLLTLFLKNLHLQHAPMAFTAFAAARAAVSKGPPRPEDAEAGLPTRGETQSKIIS
jgi:hypothetical protein